MDKYTRIDIDLCLRTALKTWFDKWDFCLIFWQWVSFLCAQTLRHTHPFTYQSVCAMWSKFALVYVAICTTSSHQNRKIKVTCAKIICNVYGPSIGNDRERKKWNEPTAMPHMTYARSRTASGTKINNVQHTLHIAHILTYSHTNTHYNYGVLYSIGHTTSTWRHWRFVIKPKTKCARIKKVSPQTEKTEWQKHARTHNNYVELLLKLILV